MNNDFLFELGTEELPPKALITLATALENGIKTGLDQAKLSYSGSKIFAAPRRLAVLISGLADKQPDQILERRGPAIKAAYDQNGKPTKAALGFASSCNTDIDNISKLETDKGSWLFYKQKVAGKKTTELMPEIVQQALKSLPIPKPMRWGNNSNEFIRPAHWAVMLYGNKIINTNILGVTTDNKSYGHRFHHPEAITISEPKEYEAKLKSAYVIADFAKRHETIRKQILKLAQHAVIDESLLKEVTALVEWPVALMGNFPEKFLELPPEVLITSMQKHQKCFAVRDTNNKLLPNFITISNIKSKKPQQVIAGNEKVINARLADAEFFYQTDTKKPLDKHLEQLKIVIFQKQLGSLYDKTMRITKLAEDIAKQIGADIAETKRAATLAKTDLLTEMVGEFPELQGTMGYYYAFFFKEPKDVALALQEQYLPRFSGDILPKTKVGSSIAIADRIDTIVGIFAINEAPTGDKDPFGLRRAALGVIRTIIEKKLDLDILELVTTAAKNYDLKIDINKIVEFLFERLRSYYLDQNITPQTFNAVLACKPTNLLDFDERIKAVSAFQKLPEAESLAAANKRVSNILKKAGIIDHKAKLELQEPAEKNLHKEILNKAKEIKNKNYKDSLIALAKLKQPVDDFFDKVMVMVDDKALRNSRLNLLSQLRDLFLNIADISLLQV